MALLAVPKSTDQAKQTDSNQTIRSEGSNRDSSPKTQRASLQEVGGLLLDMFTGKYLFEVVRARISPGRNMKVA